jgi:hypothetical protein
MMKGSLGNLQTLSIDQKDLLTRHHQVQFPIIMVEPTPIKISSSGVCDLPNPRRIHETKMGKEPREKKGSKRVEKSAGENDWKKCWEMPRI